MSYFKSTRNDQAEVHEALKIIEAVHYSISLRTGVHTQLLEHQEFIRDAVPLDVGSASAGWELAYARRDMILLGRKQPKVESIGRPKSGVRISGECADQLDLQSIVEARLANQ